MQIVCYNARDDTQGIEEHRIEPTLWKQLHPFQKEGVLTGIAQRGRILLADDMGLGMVALSAQLLPSTYFLAPQLCKLETFRHPTLMCAPFGGVRDRNA